MKEWTEKVWKPYILNEPSLLILDDYKVHKTETMRRMFDESDTELRMALPGYTSVLQALVVGINQLFKQYVRAQCDKLWLQKNHEVKSLVRELLIG